MDTLKTAIWLMALVAVIASVFLLAQKYVEEDTVQSVLIALLTGAVFTYSHYLLISRSESGWNRMKQELATAKLQVKVSIGKCTRFEAVVKNLTDRLSSAETKLQAEIAGRPSDERKLREHIKHLDCLYGLSDLANHPDISLSTLFKESVELLRNSHRYPDTICARVTFSGVQYKTDNFRNSESSLHAAITVDSDKLGAVEVYYLGLDEENSEPPFLKEEETLVDAVANRLSRIAELKRAGEKVQLFRDLVDRSNDFIFLVEPKWGRILDVNQRVCEGLGYSRKELLDMCVHEVEDRQASADSWQEQIHELEPGSDIVEESRFVCKDGKMFFAEMSLKRVTHDAGDYIVAIGRDVTERKQADIRQAELLKEVESINCELKDFAYMVSHDLKAPLRGIKALTTWLSADYADRLDEKGKEQFDLLSRQVDAMHNLIDGILQYSRIGRERTHREEVDLNELIRQVIETVAPPEGIEIAIEDELPTINCEPTRTIQLFQNLLSNAVKYTDRANGRITVGCIEQEDSWTFNVSDNGIGIDGKDLERIFQIFETASASGRADNTGVGLAVAKKIVEYWGGKIWVESTLGQGSTFFFTLPKREVEAKNAEYETNIAC